MIKNLTIACLTGAMMMTAATAGTPAPSGKGVVIPPPPAVACPGGISYNNVGLTWDHTWFNETGVSDGNGVTLNVEYSPVQNFFITASGSWQRVSVDGFDIDNWGALVGVGGYIPLVKNLDFVTDIGGAFEGSHPGSSASGFYVRPHLRAKIGCFELHAGAKYYDVSDDKHWELFADAYYEIARNLDFTVGGSWTVDLDNNASSLAVGLRYKY